MTLAPLIVALSLGQATGPRVGNQPNPSILPEVRGGTGQTSLGAGTVTATGTSTTKTLGDWAKSGPLDASASSVTPTGDTFARSMADIAARTLTDVVNVKDPKYGAKGDGVTDDTAAIQAAIDYLTGSAGAGPGGTLYFPPGTYYVLGQLVFKNTGTGAPPSQPNIRLQGAGAHFSGNGSTPSSGTILDLRYAGATGPGTKIDTRGQGALEISGITFATLGGSDSDAFIQTTNTTLLIHHCAFWGNKAGALADQDAIILGGTTTTVDGSATAAFQGYGTVVRDNYFNRIRRGVYGRIYANGVVVRDNTFWNAAGTNLAAGAAIEFLGTNVSVLTGNVITGNLVEMVHYKYAVSLTDYCNQNTVSANNLFDANAFSLGGTYLGANTYYNRIVDGYTAPGLTAVVDVSPGTNQHMGLDAAVSSQVGTQGGTFTYLQDDVVQKAASTARFAHFASNTTGEQAYWRANVLSGNPYTELYVVPNGGAEQALARGKSYGVNQGAWQIRGSTFAALEAPDGDLRIRAATNSTLWLGDQTVTPVYVQANTKSLVINNAAGKISMGSSSGPSITTGTAVPSAAEPDGSIYMRSGAPNGSLYVRQNGAWVLK